MLRHILDIPVSKEKLVSVEILTLELGEEIPIYDFIVIR